MSIVERERVETPTVTEGDVLERAADLLEEFGWCQGDFARDHDGEGVGANAQDALSFCVLGAMLRASRELKYIPDGVGPWAPAARLSEVLGLARFYLSRWNDASHRTREEVVAKLREAATRARQAA